MSIAVSIIISILGLGFLILVHEFGHFVVAKLSGMRVEEFSIGFGRYLTSWRRGETVYGISAVPLGGYVRVTGMHEEEFQARVDAVKGRADAHTDSESRVTGPSAISDEEIVQTPLERRYYARPVWQRIVFIVSGVSMNVVAAFVLLFFVGIQGYLVPGMQIDQVEEGTPAAAAELQAGDRIVSLAGEETESWSEVQQAILAHPEETVTIVLERSGQVVEKRVALDRREGDGGGYLGVAPVAEEVDPDPLEAVVFGGERTYELFALTFRGISLMITGEVPVTGSEGLAGPVGIVSISSQAVQGGYFLSLLAFISVQLAILNMLPLLPLDGGHVVFNLAEKVLGRTISLRTFERVSMVGITLFLLLMIVATSNDVGRVLFGNGGM